MGKLAGVILQVEVLLLRIAANQEARSVGLERLKIDAVVAGVDKPNADLARLLKANKARAEQRLQIEHVAADQAWRSFG